MIKAIGLSSKAGAPIQLHEQVTLIAHQGIQGDRNFGQSKWPGQNLTLIDTNQIAEVNENLGTSFTFEHLRRNILTSGIDLNALEGRQFRLGEVILFGVELCEPCAHIAKTLSTIIDLQSGKSTTPNEIDIVKALTHRGGLRCDIICGGTLSIGMTLELDDTHTRAPE